MPSHPFLFFQDNTCASLSQGPRYNFSLEKAMGKRGDERSEPKLRRGSGVLPWKNLTPVNLCSSMKIDFADKSTLGCTHPQKERPSLFYREATVE